MSGDIIAGLALAREMLECDRDALVECGTCPLDGLTPDDQIIANSYAAAMVVVDAAAAELQRLTAERDALAARLAEIGRATPPSDHPEDDLEIGPVRQPSICTSAGNIGTGNLCTAYSETTGLCSHSAECDYQQAPERPLGAKIAQLTDERIEAEFERMLGPLRDAHDQDRYLAALSWYRRGARFAERAHRIGTEPARPCRTCGPDGCADSTAGPRDGGAA